MANNTNYPKRLIEVDLPIKRISAHARREKSIRHGHISTLHIWWARRPLAACRAVICAALWPDPADPLCPEAFREKARDLMKQWAKNNLKIASPESFNRFNIINNNPDKLKDNVELRMTLLDFIADFANWDNSTVKEYLETCRALTQSSHEALGGEPGTRPLVVDPFAGGGAIPLEALRVGTDAFASDLNSVAVLLNKVVLEYIPKYGQRLADEVRIWGQWIKEQAEKELAEFYPSNTLPAHLYAPAIEKIKKKDNAVWSLEKVSKETPLAYLWARTIQCEGPGCGAEIPLMRSLWLAKKASRSIALRLIPNTEQKKITFDILESHGRKWQSLLEPSLEIESPKFDGTVRRGSATCPVCGYTTVVSSVRKQLKAHRGGAKDARLITVVCLLNTERRSSNSNTVTEADELGRFYRLPTQEDLDAINKTSQVLEQIKLTHKTGLSLVPDEPTPVGGGSGAGRAFSQRNYGMDKFEDLFTPRQALTLGTLGQLISSIEKKLSQQTNPGLATAVQTAMALAFDRQANTLTSLSRWNTVGEKIEGLFARQAIPIVWDFTEANMFSNATGSLEGAIQWIINVCERESILSEYNLLQSNVEKTSATMNPLPDDAANAFITDPPYYDAVPYADLSDFFYVWLKRNLPKSLSDLFSEELTCKDEECVLDQVKGHDKTYFEKTMFQAMAEGRRILNASGVGVVVFAHKSTTGWEAQLQAMVDAGWVITGSWPVDTEMGSRLRAMDSAALASSVHLVCRPRRKEKVEVGDWRDVLQELPKRIRDWMPRLASEGIVGADAIFACLGPALEIFSRYSRVEKASGEQVKLKDYLEHVWAAVAKEALNMIFTGADATGFEEDARLTAMWLWTLTAGTNGSNSGAEEETEEAEDEDDDSDSKPAKTTGFILEFDAARKIAQGLGAHLENLSSLVETKGDKARLLPVSERGRYLFGKQEEKTAEKGKKKPKKDEQLTFSFLGNEDTSSTTQDDKFQAKPGSTVLDRIHQTMLLFSAGRSEALKRFLVEDGVGQDQRFWGLAQALSALYPTGTDEKRWVDGVLARKKGLGF